MLTREKNKIIYANFILSILVIFVHSINDTTNKLQRFFSIDNGIGQFAVPLFFVISGFLFFRNVKSVNDVKNKINKRIHTVLYPYLLWNIIYYVVHLLIKGGNTFSLIELFEVAFNYTYNPAFWFMFQLILLIAISPIIFNVLKEYKYFGIFAIIVSLTILLNIDVPFINEDAIIYFSFGGLASKLYNEGKISLIEKKYAGIFLFISIFIFLLNRILIALCNMSIQYAYAFTYTIVLVRLSVAILIFYILDCFFKYNKVPKFMGNTFFLYAIHFMIVKGVIAVMQMFIYTFLEPDYWLIVKNVTFFVSPVVCIIVNYYICIFLKRNFPKALNMLSGNRS